jgi:4-amino-4-deoxy-L-arabinose transferase-like glycosyltransferase
MTIWRWSARGVWLGPLAFALSLIGTELLSSENVRIRTVPVLLVAGSLAVVAWCNAKWAVPFPNDCGKSKAPPEFQRRRFAFGLLAGAILVSAFSHAAYLRAPHATFGLAGWLWLAGISLVIAAALLRPAAGSAQDASGHLDSPNWTRWEMAVLSVIALFAVLLRVWNLRNVPFNIYPDEIMTGSVAERLYLLGPSPPLFSTVWSDVELPALWFAIVAAALKLGGVSLAVVRLPAALFGAATVLPFYGFLRNTWGRVAAISGSSIMAFSAVDVHYSRMALNNITTPFFWTVCFFFLMRGLRTRMPIDWILAGLAGGISEHFYYGTRLLPFILVAFVAYLVVIHWCHARHYLTQLGWLVLGYLVGFGPLLSYFVTHHGLYYGRGAGLMTWNHVPTSWLDFQKMWHTLWPIASENLLGISTRTAQDIMYYAPLLLKPEAALLVLGVTLILWRWRHPAAFLLLVSGVGVLVVGGTLVMYPNGSPPMPAHWTPAFPAFYAAIAVPFGAWIQATEASPSQRWRWIAPALVALGLAILACANIDFYFREYYADPETLRSKHYRTSQTLYEEQTIQSRYMASLGPNYRVIVVGRSPYPYDAETTRYLVSGQEYIIMANPEPALSSIRQSDGKGLAFLLFPGNEQYREIIHARFPGGTDKEVPNSIGQHLFWTYLLKPN